MFVDVYVILFVHAYQWHIIIGIYVYRKKNLYLKLNKILTFQHLYVIYISMYLDFSKW